MMTQKRKTVLAASLTSLMGLVAIVGCDDAGGGAGAGSLDAGPSVGFDGSAADSAVVPPDSAQPDSAQPDSAQPDSAQPDSAQPVPEAFNSDFEAALPAAISPGTGVLTPSQGYAPLGPAGNQFGAFFLRSPTGNVVKLSLTNLPTHTTVSLRFLFAAIDSLDGTGTFPAGDFFRVTLDGKTIFRHSFANATAEQIQDYLPPAGVELARRVDLGFQGPGGYYTDSAYDMGADPSFLNIPHTASTAVVELTLEGDGVQTLDDESWAIDNLRVTTN